MTFAPAPDYGAPQMTPRLILPPGLSAILRAEMAESHYLDVLNNLLPSERSDLLEVLYEPDFEAVALSESPPPSMADFVNATAGFEVEPWQRLLCERLESLSTRPGSACLSTAHPSSGSHVTRKVRF